MRVRLAIIVMCLAAFGIGLGAFQSASPEHDRGIFPTDPSTPYVRIMPEGASLGRVLVLHGLGANKELMKPAGMAMADGGFEVYLIDLPGHGDSMARLSSADSTSVVDQLIPILGEDTILVGHSMGGGFLAEFASSNAVRTMVLYSPAPIPTEEIHAERLLVVSGRFDGPMIDQAIPRLLDAVGDHALWWRYRWGTHSNSLFSPRKLRAVIRWMGGRTEALRTNRRFGALALMTLVGVILPLAWPIERRQADPSRQAEPPLSRHVIVEYVLAASVSVVLLRFVRPLEWLGLFATDYMLGVVLIAGLLLWRGRSFSLSLRGLAVAVGSAVYVIGIFIFMIGSHFVDVMPTGTQWLRVPIFTVIALPLFLYDEETLGWIPGLAKRWGTFLLTRGLLWPIVITGVILLDRTEGLLVLIMHLVLCFWLALWCMSGFVARRTGEPAAAALFAALVQGWAFATIFVRTS